MMKIFRKAILAGICIGIAGFGYLAIGGIFGAIIFAFGLAAVVSYALKLYTGTAGFIKLPAKTGELLLILAGNLVGCLVVAMLTRVSPMPLQDTAQNILVGRLSNGWLNCGLLAIGCGFIMTTAVEFARRDNWYPLIFGVPMFIICGFPHSIADAFYYMSVPLDFIGENILKIIPLYVSIVVGNFIGCNLYRVIAPQE